MPVSRQNAKKYYELRRQGYKTQIAARRSARYSAARRATGNRRTGGFVDVENKFLDSELVASTVAATWLSLNPSGTGCTNSISVPAQGDGESERDGRVYTINSVHIAGLYRTTVTEGLAAPPGPIKARAVLYWDTQTNAAEATASDIFTNLKDEDVLAFRNLQNSKRFIVLKDKIVTLRPEVNNDGSVNSFSAGPACAMFKMNKKFKKGIKVRCAGTTANVSSVTDNNLGLCFVRDDGAAVPVTVEYQSRIRFTG